MNALQTYIVEDSPVICENLTATLEEWVLVHRVAHFGGGGSRAQTKDSPSDGTERLVPLVLDGTLSNTKAGEPDLDREASCPRRKERAVESPILPLRESPTVSCVATNRVA